MAFPGSPAIAVARLALALAFAFELAGCAAVPIAEPDLCPESRGLRCLTPPRCSTDRARGCRTCACTAWDPSPSAETEQAGRPIQPERDPSTPPGDVSRPRP